MDTERVLENPLSDSILGPDDDGDDDGNGEYGGGDEGGDEGNGQYGGGGEGGDEGNGGFTGW